MERTITPEIIEKYKKAMENPVARERIKSSLQFHAEAGMISPALAILAILYDSTPSLEFQEKMIEELSGEGL